MKTKLLISLIVISSLLLASCGNRKSGKEKEESTTEVVKETAKDTIIKEEMNKDLAFDPAQLPEEPIFNINTTMGTITVKLYKDTPAHRANFIKLAAERFYDNILFHRVINGFMIQAGDPLTKDPSKSDQYGTGGPGYTIPSEIILNQLTHKKGALAAARRPDTVNPEKKSSGSQFYIVQNEEACKQLDGEYTIFGETVKGLDVIDKIATVRTVRDRPVEDIRIISIEPVL